MEYEDILKMLREFGPERGSHRFPVTTRAKVYALSQIRATLVWRIGRMIGKDQQDAVVHHPVILSAFRCDNPTDISRRSKVQSR